MVAETPGVVSIVAFGKMRLRDSDKAVAIVSGGNV